MKKLCLFLAAAMLGCAVLCRGISVSAQSGAACAQSGPYGEISILLSEGWQAVCIPQERSSEIDGLYGMQLRKEGSDSFIFLSYYHSFGVCGTGLTQEEITLAGDTAWMGSYDGNTGWSFIRFTGAAEGVVAAACISDEDWPDYADVLAVLDTVRFDPERRQGGDCYYTPGSESVELGLQMSLKEIDAGGAIIVMNQWDAEVITGELCFGSEFRLDRWEDGKWVPLPEFTEDLIFTSEAYLIQPGSLLELPCRWESLCGSLTPGTYRLVKTVSDFQAPGQSVSCELEACFVWGGESITETDSDKE